MPTGPKLMEVRKATVYRGKVKVFEDFSLDLASGQNTAILGPNGAGKTTFLKLISRELYPARLPGSFVRILGHERWNVFELRDQLGLVSHELQVRYQRDVSGIHVILSGFYSSIGVFHHQTFTAEQRERAQALMDQLGIGGLGETSFQAMSAGEQRRFLLARALVNDPHTLVLDEPTTSLDLKSAFELLALLRRLVSAGKTLILVTHHIHEIPPEVTRVVLLRRGKVFAQGEKESVLTRENLTELYGFPIELVEKNGFFQAVPG